MRENRLILQCPRCRKFFPRKASIVRELRKRNPQVQMCCGTQCASSLKRRVVKIEDRKIFEYLIGVVLGDGHVGDRAVRVAVGLQDEEYVEVLSSLFQLGVGTAPTIQRNVMARSYQVVLCFLAGAELFQPYKYLGGCEWSLKGIKHPGFVLGGLCDTDGGWEIKKGRRIAFTITQKDNGNLERTLPLWKSLGIIVTLRHYAVDRAVLRVPSTSQERFQKKVMLFHPRKKFATPDWYPVRAGEKRSSQNADL